MTQENQKTIEFVATVTVFLAVLAMAVDDSFAVKVVTGFSSAWLATKLLLNTR